MDKEKILKRVEVFESDVEYELQQVDRLLSEVKDKVMQVRALRDIKAEEVRAVLRGETDEKN